MRKRIINILLATCILISMMPLAALAVLDYTFFTAKITVGGNPVDCTFKVITEPTETTNGTVEIASSESYAPAIAKASSGELTIPTTVSRTVGESTYTYDVTTIGTYAFFECSKLTGALNIPDGVTTIGSSAFNWCSGFNGILTIPDTVTSIGSGAFSGCRNLTGNLTIPTGVTIIENSVFFGCSGLTGTLTIPDGVTKIGSDAFNNCRNLTGPLAIPTGVTTIGSQAFWSCSGFTGSLTIPANITSIGELTFANCTGFTGSLNIPTKVTTIGDYAFGNTKFTGALTIPTKVTTIGNGAFNNCPEITTLKLQSNSLPTMGTDVFKGSTKLNTLIVPAAWAGNSVALSGISTSLTTASGGLIKDAGLISVLGQTIDTPTNSNDGTASGTPITWSIDVPNSKTEVTVDSIVPAGNATAKLYSNVGFDANENQAIALTEGGATTAYIKVTASDTGTIRYHAVTINRATPPSDITEASVTITAPVLGATPQDATAVQAATNNDDYTVTGLTWNEPLTEGNKFKAEQVYTATVTLTSKNNHKFQDAPFTPTVANSASVGTTTTSGGAFEGNHVSFTVTYAATGALEVSSIAVTTQPTKMSYTETTDAVLELDGMQVTETNNDGSTNVVTFTNGTATGYTANPANGTAMTRATHNGNPVVITHTASGKTANTNNLTVTIDAVSPVITNDLSTTQVEYSYNYMATALNATATVTDGGLISYAWYSNTTNNTAGATPLGITTATYTPSTATVGTTYYYCVVTNTNIGATGTQTAHTTSSIANIKVLAPSITEASITITAPVLGATPQNATAVQETTNNADFTVTGLTWNEPFTTGNKFKAGQVYTATITLTSKNGKKFQGAPFTPTVAGSASVGTTTTAGGAVVGNTVSFTVNYAATGALTVSSIAVTTQPAKTIYTEITDAVLALDGMKVTETNNDGSTKVVTFTDGTATGYTANPSNGTTLTNSTHNGKPVVITHTASGKTANTDNLTVKKDAVAPVITEDLSTAQVVYDHNYAATALDATATVTDGGTISYEWYSNTNNNTAGATSLGITTATYTPSTAEAGTTYYYCVVTNTNIGATGTQTAQTASSIANIKVLSPNITEASVTITAPELGAVPQDAAAVQDATRNDDFTVTGLNWNEPLTAGNKFKPDQVYTATVTLTSKNGKKFQDTPFTPTVAGSASVGTTTTAGGAVVGNTVSFTVTYAATGALEVSSIAVTTQPAKMIYTEITDAVLALDGMQVIETNNDGSTNVVSFTNGTATGYTANPANGATLTNATHNGKPVVITHTASGKTANTDNLTVKKDAVAPVITNDLSTTQVVYNHNSAATALDATATVSDGGNISYAWYSNTTDSTVGAISTGVTTATYTPTTAVAGTTYYYCVVTNTNSGATGNQTTHITSSIANIKVLAPDITEASVTITAPVLGATPQNATAVQEATNNPDFTVTGLTWNEPFTTGNKFKAGQVYTATITLTSKNGKKFQNTPFTPTVAGSASVGTTTTAGGAVVGNTVSFTVTYTATGALEVSSIAVSTQPTKMSYTETTDAILALNSMQVTETNNDGSTNVITFTNGTATGYTTNPANGTTLTRAIHNGNPVVITHTASGKTANAGNLTVAPAPSGDGYESSSTIPVKPIITISEVKTELFSNAKDIKVEADVSSAFGQSVAVKITDIAESQKEIFSLTGTNDIAYPFDISLHSTTSGEKVQPKEGYSVKITLPVPEKLLEDREKIKVVYGRDGKLETLKSELIEKDGKWYISFEAIHFSPYALIVSKEQPIKPWTNPFSDVEENNWFYSAVQYAAQNGLMNGTSSNTFSPGIATSRGMIATILYKLSGPEETEQSTFKDVSPSAYYATAIAWAQKKGIIAGYGNEMFGPDDSITREQVATILWKYARSPEATDSNVLAAFKDAGEISSYAKDAMAWANQLGIINGMGNGLLDPKGKATRAEVAQIMQNFIQKTALIK